MRKAKLAITVFFFHSASIGFENSSANRRRIEKQKASQYVGMCYHYPQSHKIDRVTGRLFKPSGFIYTSFRLY